jgi:hypothetical protein
MFLTDGDDRSAFSDLRDGLVDLLEKGWTIWDRFYRLVEDGTPLTGHPFGLEAMPKTDVLRTNAPFLLIGSMYGTDRTVEAMISIVQQFLKWNEGTVDRVAFRMRIIRVTCSGDSTQDVFFEIDSPKGLFICGGCTDGYIGAGPAGTRRLISVFNLVSLVCEVPFDEVIIADSTAQEVRMNLACLHRDSRSREVD